MIAEPVELKTCELCGRLFVRPITPQLRLDPATGAVVSVPKQRDCSVCVVNPPTEEEEQVYVRSYRCAVKI